MKDFNESDIDNENDSNMQDFMNDHRSPIELENETSQRETDNLHVNETASEATSEVIRENDLNSTSTLSKRQALTADDIINGIGKDTEDKATSNRTKPDVEIQPQPDSAVDAVNTMSTITEFGNTGVPNTTVQEDFSASTIDNNEQDLEPHEELEPETEESPQPELSLEADEDLLKQFGTTIEETVEDGFDPHTDSQSVVEPEQGIDPGYINEKPTNINSGLEAKIDALAEAITTLNMNKFGAPNVAGPQQHDSPIAAFKDMTAGIFKGVGAVAGLAATGASAANSKIKDRFQSTPSSALDNPQDAETNPLQTPTFAPSYETVADFNIDEFESSFASVEAIGIGLQNSIDKLNQTDYMHSYNAQKMMAPEDITKEMADQLALQREAPEVSELFSDIDTFKDNLEMGIHDIVNIIEESPEAAEGLIDSLKETMEGINETFENIDLPDIDTKAVEEAMIKLSEMLDNLFNSKNNTPSM